MRSIIGLNRLRDFKELLEGRYDEVPEKAFYFVGTIDQALAKSKTLEKN